MPDTVIVTGCEKNYFLMACTLLHTLKRWCPDVPVYVLDFGLDVAQKRFLADRAIVLDRPSDLPPHLDPFLYKAAIAKYLRPIDWSTIVWLDCDMIAVGPIRQRLNEVVTEMERNSIEVAACLDISETIGALLAGGYKAEPFVAAEIGTHRVPGHLFFCRTPAAFNVQRTVLSDFLTQSIGELRSSGLTLPAT